MKARKIPLGGHIRTGSIPVISSPSWRHENIPEVCRIHSSILGRIMTTTRLHLPGLTLSQSWILIRLLSCPHMIRGFRQMARHRSNRLAVSLALPDPLIQLTHMSLRMGLSMQTDRMSRFNISPPQIAIDIGPQAPIPDLIPTRMHPGSCTRIGSIPIGTGKTLPVSHFQGDDRRQNPSHPGQAPGSIHLRWVFDQLPGLRFHLLDLPLPKIQLLQQHLGDLSRLRRQPAYGLTQLPSSFLPKGITGFSPSPPLFTQRGLNPILQTTSMPRQNHPSPGHLPLIPKLPRRNPHGRQRPVPLQLIHPLRIQLAGLIHQSHHQLRFPRKQELLEKAGYRVAHRLSGMTIFL